MTNGQWQIHVVTEVQKKKKLRSSIGDNKGNIKKEQTATSARKK